MHGPLLPRLCQDEQILQVRVRERERERERKDCNCDSDQARQDLGVL